MDDDPTWRPAQRAVEALLRDHLHRLGTPDHTTRAAGAVASLFACIGRDSVVLRDLTVGDVRDIIAATTPPAADRAGATRWTRRFLRAVAAHRGAQLRPATTAQETPTA